MPVSADDVTIFKTAEFLCARVLIFTLSEESQLETHFVIKTVEHGSENMTYS